MSHRVRVVVVTFNNSREITDCIRSLKSQEGVKLEIVLVDNGSTDGTLDILNRDFEDLEVIRSEGNIGYAGGSNLGLSRNGLPKYVAFVNPDTISEPRWIAAAIDRLEARNEAGSCQPRIMLVEDRSLLNSRGNQANVLFFGWPDGYGELPEAVEAERSIPFCSGAAVVFRRECLEDTGGYDDSYFMYGEDMDLGIRLLVQGWTNLYCPQAIVYHQYEFRESAQKYFLLERNRIMSLLKIYRARTLGYLFPLIILCEVGVLFRASSQGWLSEKIMSYGSVCVNGRRLLSERMRTQSRRRRKDCELISALKGDLDFEALGRSRTLLLGNRLLRKYHDFLLELRI